MKLDSNWSGTRIAGNQESGRGEESPGQVAEGVWHCGHPDFGLATKTERQ
jgi:hypothetical protein